MVRDLLGLADDSSVSTMLVKVICRMLIAVAASMALAWWRMTALASPRY